MWHNHFQVSPSKYASQKSGFLIPTLVSALTEDGTETEERSFDFQDNVLLTLLQRIEEAKFPAELTPQADEILRKAAEDL